MDWAAADEFLLERWLLSGYVHRSSKGRADDKFAGEASGMRRGRRLVIGRHASGRKNMAMHEARLVHAGLLYGFDIESDDG